MQSPFKIFRKHQKAALAALTLMAMIGFGLGDIVRQMSGGGGSVQREETVVFETNLGNLTESTIRNLSNQRRILHRFIYDAFLSSHREYEKSQFAGWLVQQAVENYGFGGLSEDHMLDKWLFQHEARQQGIVVSDSQVTEYIEQVTTRKLSNNRFLEIVRSLQISPKELYDIIRGELEASTARQLTFSPPLPSPEKYWEYFQQLHTRQKLAVAAVPVNSFIDQAGTPTEAQVARLFNDHRYEFERAFNGEFRPGFRQPQKVKLQYLEISQVAAEEKARALKPVTEQDIVEYYDTKKATDIRMQERAPAGPDEKAPLNPELTPESEKGPQLEGADEKPEAEQPAPATPPEEKAPEDKPAEDKPAEEKPAEEKPAEEKPAEEKPAEEKPAEEKASEGCVQSPVADETEEKPAGDAPEKPASTEEPAADAQPVPGDSPKSEPESEPQPSQPAAPAEEAAEPTVDDKPEGKGDDKPAAPEIRYKPLDDDLKDYIRSILVNDRANTILKDTAENARRAMSRVAESFADSKEIKLVDPSEQQLVELEKRAASELRKIGEQLELKYGETDLVSARELSEIPGLGRAYDPEAQVSLRGEGTTIIEQAFTTDALCQAFESETLGMSRYIVWKVRDVPSHIPELTEAGIREQVVAAWKRQAAEPLARKRADELAERARIGNSDFQKAIADETVTGAASGPALATFETGEFSFWQESTVANPMSRARPVQIGNPTGVVSPGMKFMQIVFDQLAEGDVGVALNDDATIYYVVKVLDRRPADREEFKDARLFEGSAYASIAQRENEMSRMDRSERIRTKYAIRMRDLPQRRGRTPSFDDE